MTVDSCICTIKLVGFQIKGECMLWCNISVLAMIPESRAQLFQGSLAHTSYMTEIFRKDNTLQIYGCSHSKHRAHQQLVPCKQGKRSSFKYTLFHTSLFEAIWRNTYITHVVQCMHTALFRKGLENTIGTTQWFAPTGQGAMAGEQTSRKKHESDKQRKILPRRRRRKYTFKCRMGITKKESKRVRRIYG